MELVVHHTDGDREFYRQSFRQGFQSGYSEAYNRYAAEFAPVFRWVFIAAFAGFALAFVFLLRMEEKPLRTSAARAAAGAAAD